MDRKPLALFCMAIVAIAGMVMVSACTTTVTPTATPTATPTPTPPANTTPTPTPPANVVTAFNQSNNHSTANVKTGDIFQVSLEENPSTGYSWNATVTSGLNIINSTYLPPNSALVGAPGTHVWQIQANGTGAQEFNGVYRRSFENLTGNETTFVLYVNVTA